jgi:hypothetical protein
MYFRVSYTISPAILHILPHHFTMVSPLDRQLNSVSFFGCLKLAFFRGLSHISNNVLTHSDQKCVRKYVFFRLFPVL